MAPEAKPPDKIATQCNGQYLQHRKKLKKLAVIAPAPPFSCHQPVIQKAYPALFKRQRQQSCLNPLRTWPFFLTHFLSCMEPSIDTHEARRKSTAPDIIIEKKQEGKDTHKTGRWSEDEEKRFKNFKKIFGNKWHLYINVLYYRTRKQIKSHAQNIDKNKEKQIKTNNRHTKIDLHLATRAVERPTADGPTTELNAAATALISLLGGSKEKSTTKIEVNKQINEKKRKREKELHRFR